jgi:hypothetical protein
LQSQKPLSLAAITKKAANILMAMREQAFNGTRSKEASRACN